MFYDYPSTPHERIHGPSGYEDYRTYKEWLRDEFEFRCVYCLKRERWATDDEDRIFGADHVFPKGLPQYEHLECEYTNLIYSCNRCNTAKLTAILIDPCREGFSTHLRIKPSGEIEWLTVEGEKIVRKLKLDSPGRTRFRRWLLEFHRAALTKPDGDTAKLLRYLMSYPDDLPDLGSMRPPRGNTKPEGISRSHFERRKRNELPETY
jgi:hypothetical protein